MKKIVVQIDFYLVLKDSLNKDIETEKASCAVVFALPMVLLAQQLDALSNLILIRLCHRLFLKVRFLRCLLVALNHTWKLFKSEGGTTFAGILRGPEN